MLEWLLLAAGIGWCIAFYYRRQAGFRHGQTLSRDDLTLRSERYGLVGRPDRIVRSWGQWIVEDKKSGTRLYDSHRAQMGVYMLLVEEHFGKRPPHAIIVLGDGRREKVKNTRALRKLVLETVQQIRDARQHVHRELTAKAAKGKCRVCAQRHNCGQAAT